MTEKTLDQIAYEAYMDDMGIKHDWAKADPIIKRAYKAVAEAVCEQCADICDQHSSVEGIAQKCAVAIRALNTAPESKP